MRALAWRKTLQKAIISLVRLRRQLRNFCNPLKQHCFSSETFLKRTGLLVAGFERVYNYFKRREGLNKHSKFVELLVTSPGCFVISILSVVCRPIFNFEIEPTSTPSQKNFMGRYCDSPYSQCSIPWYNLD